MESLLNCHCSKKKKKMIKILKSEIYSLCIKMTEYLFLRTIKVKAAMRRKSPEIYKFVCCNLYK